MIINFILKLTTLWHIIQKNISAIVTKVLLLGDINRQSCTSYALDTLGKVALVMPQTLQGNTLWHLFVSKYQPNNINVPRPFACTRARSAFSKPLLTCSVKSWTLALVLAMLKWSILCCAPSHSKNCELSTDQVNLSIGKNKTIFRNSASHSQCCSYPSPCLMLVYFYFISI